MATDTTEPFKSVQELHNANLDRSVDPLTMVRGVMGKNGSQAWEYISSNANHILVSGSFTATTSPLSADSSKVSAIQGDAGLLHISAFNGDAGTFRVSAIGGTAGDATLVDGTTQTISATLTPVSTNPANTVQGLVTLNWQQDAGKLHTSAFAPDAGLFRVSAIGGTAGDRTLVDGTTQTISATLTPISAKPAGTVQGLVTNTFQQDASQFRVSAAQIDAGVFHASAFVDSGSVSAKSPDANNLHASAVQGDAGLLHISGFTATATNFPVSATQADAGLMHTSAFIDSGSVSARSGDANQVHVSAVQGDSGLFHVSAILAAAVSSVGAASFGVSAAQIDAGSLHASASIFPDATGGLTIFSNFNVSTSQNVKSTAGAVYGWYAWNMDTKPNYINLYNTSGAINVGTDTIQVQIALAPSAAANVFTPIGLKGFTNGIGVAAVSGAVSTSNSSPAASAVGINLFFK